MEEETKLNSIDSISYIISILCHKSIHLCVSLNNTENNELGVESVVALQSFGSGVSRREKALSPPDADDTKWFICVVGWPPFGSDFPDNVPCFALPFLFLVLFLKLLRLRLKVVF